MSSFALIAVYVLARFGDKEGRAYALHAKPLLHIAILSAASNYEKRMACRETWLNDLPRGVTAVFMVLASNDPATVERLYKESTVHRDIHFVRATEGYYQITHGTMSAVAGAYTRAEYLMKCDDDTFVRVHAVVRKLREPNHAKFWLYGTISWKAGPGRTGKWGLSRKEYPGKTFPPFAHGPGYIVSAPLGNWLAAHPIKKYIKLEDVAMGVWVDSARQAGVPVVIEHGHFATGCSNRGFISHYMSADQMRCMATGRLNCCH